MKKRNMWTLYKHTREKDFKKEDSIREEEEDWFILVRHKFPFFLFSFFLRRNTVNKKNVNPPVRFGFSNRVS